MGKKKSQLQNLLKGTLQIAQKFHFDFFIGIFSDQETICQAMAHLSLQLDCKKSTDIFSNLFLRSFYPGSFWWKRTGFHEASAQAVLSSHGRAEEEDHAWGDDTFCCSWALKEEWIGQHLPPIAEEHSDVRETKWGWSPHPFFPLR